MHSSRSLKLSTTFKWLLAAGMVSTLAACGGDGSSEPVTPPPVPKKTLTVVGTAATGLAIANGSVNATCRVGTGTATTAADGTFTVVASSTEADAVGPCVLAVSTPAGATLRSFAATDGARANITPLTELLVSYVATQAGAASNANAAALVTNTGIQTVLSTPAVLQASVNSLISVITAAAGPGVTIPNNFLNAPLTAATPANPNAGDALDKVLDTLKARAVITATGAPSTAVAQAAVQNANQNRVTGATGGS
jgi:hypothetical protein